MTHSLKKTKNYDKKLNYLANILQTRLLRVVSGTTVQGSYNSSIQGLNIIYFNETTCVSSNTVQNISSKSAITLFVCDQLHPKLNKQSHVNQ